MNVIVPKLEYAGEVSVGRERKVRKTTGNSADDRSYKDTRMLKYDEQCSSKNGTRNVPSENKWRRETVEVAI